ncbi:HNH endonuclease [Herbaspirillum sp. GCM10030257]|uniref:HNH endonuclease n=1 Tax=Herbaspirillum sp. GCM10030257 TaxID=3273393 RepID=UPI00361D0E49
MRPVIGERDVSIKELFECFVPDFESGALIWGIRPEGHFQSDLARHVYESQHFGTIAGSPDAHGHIRVRISIRGRTGTFFVHRVIWAMHYGAWPEDQIDHRNTIKADNRINNLRLATNAQNMANRGLQKNNKSGAKGVHFNKNAGRYQAYIKHLGKRYHLGYFDTVEAASAAHQKAAKQMFGEFAHP